jgi:hypothetical protein
LSLAGAASVSIVEKENNSGRIVIGTVIALGVSLFLGLMGIVPVLSGTAAAHLPAGGGVYIMIGVVLGVAFTVASVAWLIAWFTYGRLRTPDWGYAYFLMSFVFIALIYGAAASTFSRFIDVRDRAVAERRTQDVSAWGELAKTMKTAMDPHGGPIDMRIHGKGAAGEAESAMKPLLADLIAKRNTYLTQMQALGIKTIMLPANLAKDKGLKRTRANLAEARAVLKDFREATESLSVNFSHRLEATDISETDRLAMLEGFNRALNEGQDVRETIFVCQDNEFAEFQKMAALLAHPKGRWLVKGDKLYFINRDDLAAYQQSVLSVHAYADHERVAVEQARALASGLNARIQAQQGFVPPQRITY